MEVQSLKDQVRKAKELLIEEGITKSSGHGYHGSLQEDVCSSRVSQGNVPNISTGGRISHTLYNFDSKRGEQKPD